jgi:hypothetical protein
MVIANHPPISSYLDYFWGRVLTSKARNILLISEPQFFIKQGDKMDDRAYVRSLGANLALGASSLPPVRFTPQLTTPSTMPNLQAMPGTNIIVLGNPRINSVFEEQQGMMSPRPVLHVTRSRIQNRQTGVVYEDRHSENAEEQTTETETYGLFTHHAAEDNSHVVILIGGNHGRAIQNVCQAVTDLETLRLLCERVSTAKNRLAKYFQILFKITVTTIGLNGMKVRWTIEDTIVYPEKTSRPMSKGTEP